MTHCVESLSAFFQPLPSHTHPPTQNLSFKLAHQLMNVMNAMPDGPALVLCSSGGRATAVKCLRQVRIDVENICSAYQQARVVPRELQADGPHGQTTERPNERNRRCSRGGRGTRRRRTRSGRGCPSSRTRT